MKMRPFIARKLEMCVNCSFLGVKVGITYANNQHQGFDSL